MFSLSLFALPNVYVYRSGPNLSPPTLVFIIGYCRISLFLSPLFRIFCPQPVSELFCLASVLALKRQQQHSSQKQQSNSR